MADAFSQFELLLREQMSDAVQNLMLEDDDVSEALIGSFDAETKGGAAEYDTATSDFPAQFEAKYRIKLQRGGRVAGRKFTGGTVSAVGKDGHLYVGQAADAKYLDPRKTPLASYIPVKMILKRVIGDVAVNRQQFNAQLADTPLDTLVADAAIDATARARALRTNMFYSDGTGYVAQAGAATVDETAGGASVALTGGGYARFQLGDAVVAATNANPRVLRTGTGVMGGTGRMFVVDMDRTTLPGSIRLQSDIGVGTVTITANDVLMLDETYIFGGATHAVNSTSAQGVEALLITSGVFPGTTSPKFPNGCDVAHYNVLRSFVDGTEGGTEEPTAALLAQTFDAIKNAGRRTPTALIAEQAIWTRWAFLDLQSNGIAQIPAGQTYPAAGGVMGPTISHMEARYQKFTSTRIRPKSILGLTPEVWRKFVPLGDRTIAWFYGRGPMSGISSIFMPVIDGTQPTEVAHAPFDTYIEFGCLDPQANFRRVGLNTVN